MDEDDDYYEEETTLSYGHAYSDIGPEEPSGPALWLPTRDGYQLHTLTRPRPYTPIGFRLPRTHAE